MEVGASKVMVHIVTGPVTTENAREQHVLVHAAAGRPSTQTDLYVGQENEGLPHAVPLLG